MRKEIVFLAVILGFSSSSAFAYLDPGSISMALQAIVAGAVGAGMAFKMYWKQIKDFFSKKKSEKNKENT